MGPSDTLNLSLKSIEDADNMVHMGRGRFILLRTLIHELGHRTMIQNNNIPFYEDDSKLKRFFTAPIEPKNWINITDAEIKSSSVLESRAHYHDYSVRMESALKTASIFIHHYDYILAAFLIGYTEYDS
jgi:hypothetical protein